MQAAAHELEFPSPPPADPRRRVSAAEAQKRTQRLRELLRDGANYATIQQTLEKEMQWRPGPAAIVAVKRELGMPVIKTTKGRAPLKRSPVLRQDVLPAPTPTPLELALCALRDIMLQEGVTALSLTEAGDVQLQRRAEHFSIS